MIHQGKKYVISRSTTDGKTVAVKSDGTATLTMAYYPERDATALAGSVDESCVWRLMNDVAGQLPSDVPVSPEHILIDGEGFTLAEWSRSADERFTAPEGYDAVWALGASAFYILMGCHVFQGLGGKAQGPSTPIPVARRDSKQLSMLLCRCLAFDPKRRPSAQEIKMIAESNLAESKAAEPALKQSNHKAPSSHLDELWPEEM